MDLTTVLGSILDKGAANTSANSGINAASIVKELANGKSDVLGNILKNVTSNAMANNKIQGGEILGSVLKQVTQKNINNLSATDITNMAGSAVNILNAILANKK